MKDIKEFINEASNKAGMINEARMNYWMVVNYDTEVTYLVAANTIEEAKSLVENTTGADSDKVLSAWLINDLTKVKEPKIVYDSDMVRIKGDKK